jgi:dipeptidyl aminopeptidase/acylaminoacyl peptidase
MTLYPGQIIERHNVALFGHFANAFTRLYDASTFDDVKVERITYVSDGLRIKGYIAMPRKAGIYPVLLWNRGGYKDRGALDDMTAWMILGSTAGWGYVVLATQYRGNRDGEGEPDWGGKDVDDALNMLEVARNLPECDLNRVAIEGASRGGMTTYRALLKDDRFRCAIVHAGLSDLIAICDVSENFRVLTDRITEGMSEEARREKIQSLSAVYFANKLPRTVPILLLHGTNDDTVPVDQTTRLAARFDTYGIPYKLELIEGGGHVALKDGSYARIDELRKEWLEKYLQVR